MTGAGFTCEQCGAALGRGHRFCSQPCWHQWQHEHPPRLERVSPSPEEFEAEARAALDNLRRFIDGD